MRVVARKVKGITPEHRFVSSLNQLISTFKQMPPEHPLKEDAISLYQKIIEEKNKELITASALTTALNSINMMITNQANESLSLSLNRLGRFKRSVNNIIRNGIFRIMLGFLEIILTMMMLTGIYYIAASNISVSVINAIMLIVVALAGVISCAVLSHRDIKSGVRQYRLGFLIKDTLS